MVQDLSLLQDKDLGHKFGDDSCKSATRLYLGRVMLMVAEDTKSQRLCVCENCR